MWFDDVERKQEKINAKTFNDFDGSGWDYPTESLIDLRNISRTKKRDWEFID